VSVVVALLLALPWHGGCDPRQQRGRIVARRPRRSVATRLLLISATSPTQSSGDALRFARQGVAQIDAGHYDDAIHSLTSAIRLDPTPIAYHYELAFAHYLKGQWQLAIDIL